MAETTDFFMNELSREARKDFDGDAEECDDDLRYLRLLLQGLDTLINYFSFLLIELNLW